ncbi:MAG: PL29 family lyase N-terminal domain-containing protein [Candidatus Cryptobacteroides sp.]
MKKIFSIIIIPALIAGLFASCSDLTSIEQRVDELENRVAALETQVNTLNSNIATLQALANGGIISSVSEENGVYTITLGDGRTLTLAQGSIGVANAPVVSIDKDGYWMVDNEYILVDGQKVKAVGADGITPVFGVDANGYWTVSYDGGKNFERVKGADGNPVKAIPDSGIQDKWFDSVEVKDGKLVVVTKDDKTYSLPIVADFLCSIKNTEDIVLFNAGETKNFTVEMNGVASALVTAPNGWSASLSETTLSVTAPAASTKAVSADSKTDVCILAVSTTGFSSIAKVKVQLSDAPVVVNPAATVAFESATVNSITFKVTTIDATEWKYICQAASEAAPDAAKIAADGTAGTGSTVTIEGLTAETEYTLYVLPINGETKGEIASATGKTLVPEYPGLYGKYMKGEDVVIGGITINKTTHPNAHFITAESESKVIGTSGVYFIDPAVNDATLSSGNQSLIVTSNTEERVTVSRKTQLAMKATEGEDYFHMYNVKYVTGLTSGNMLGVNGDEAKTFVFESISFEKCEFEVPKDMNFMYAQYNIASFSMVDCDVKLHANTAEKNILSTNTNNTITYALTFKNNIIYCTDGDVPAYQIFKNTNATVSSLEFSKNTFAKVYPKAAFGFCAAKSINTASVVSNLFYIPDYTDLVKDTDGTTKYSGIVYATDKVNTGFTFTSNLAYYDAASLPSPRLKCDYYMSNDPEGSLYAKIGTDNPLETADFTNGIFTQTEKYKSFGAQR